MVLAADHRNVIHLAHDLSGERVLIFGGGRVGSRRARTLGQADVVVISPRFADRGFGGAARVRAEPGPSVAGELVARADPGLVVAATDEEAVNDAVAAAGRMTGALVNRADATAGSAGSVDVPATARAGPVVASVSSGGASPSLSAHLRDEIQAVIDGSDALAELIAALRADCDRRGITGEQRRRALRAVAESDEVWAAVREDGNEATAVADAVFETALEEAESGD